MSSRRAYRSGLRSGVVVPVELRSVDDPLWSSAPAVRRWCAEQGLVWPEHRVSSADCAVRRRDRVARVWALAHGLGSAGFPAFVDHARCREVGLTFVGVRGVKAAVL